MELEWLRHAQALPEGGSRKVGHSCGVGDCLHINHKRDGWTAYCHRCEYKRFIPRPAESLTEKLARLKRVQAAEEAVAWDTSLPMPAVYEPQEWPLTARVWLYKAGLSNVEIQALGFYWNPRLQRVVIPVRDEAGEVVYWQARTLDKSNPKKVINPRADKSGIVYRAGAGPSLALTEDILSTLKLGKCGVESWALLGTKLSSVVATRLLTEGRPIVVALDPDGAGQRAAKGITKQLRAYGCTVTNIVFDKDPKLIGRDAIHEEFRGRGISFTA